MRTSTEDINAKLTERLWWVVVRNDSGEEVDICTEKWMEAIDVKRIVLVNLVNVRWRAVAETRRG